MIHCAVGLRNEGKFAWTQASYGCEVWRTSPFNGTTYKFPISICYFFKLKSSIDYKISTHPIKPEPKIRPVKPDAPHNMLYKGAYTHISDTPLDHQLKGNLENESEVDTVFPSRLNFQVEAMLPLHSIHVLQSGQRQRQKSRGMPLSQEHRRPCINNTHWQKYRPALMPIGQGMNVVLQCTELSGMHPTCREHCATRTWKHKQHSHKKHH